MKILVASLCLTLAAATASADIILHDEAVDGDLPTVVSQMDFGVLDPGSYLIIGTLDGGTAEEPGPDPSDGFMFETLQPWSLDVVSLSGGNGELTVRPSLLAFELVEEPQDGFLTDVPADSYLFSFQPEDGIGDLSYTFRINVIPEPASVMLLGVGGLAMLWRRRTIPS